VAPLFAFPLDGHCTFDRYSTIFLRKNKANKLDKNYQHFNLDNLYSKPLRHVLSMAFSVSKKTANVDVLFF
jgi:hypothetical protein